MLYEVITRDPAQEGGAGAAHVITSYSIHYTKLYDAGEHDLLVGVVEA
ncbi:hypothetical protein [Streptomyces cyaneogriseus]|nr:hypothetical protein [Streptomyces cyaneogriseus]